MTFNYNYLLACSYSSVNYSSSDVKFYFFIKILSSFTFCVEFSDNKNLIYSFNYFILFSYFVSTFYWSISARIFRMHLMIWSSHDFSVTVIDEFVCWLFEYLGLWEECKESKDGCYWWLWRISEGLRRLSVFNGLIRFFKV